MCDGKNGFEKTKHRFPYEWTLKDANFTKDKGTVFSCFACGGGSTMGYKLAGFDVLGFNEKEIPLKEFAKGEAKRETQNYTKNRFGDVMLSLDKASNTLATDINRYWLDENTLIDKKTVSLIGTYPTDYNHLKLNNPQYLIGMSVPPVMTAQIATEIYDQWLSKL